MTSSSKNSDIPKLDAITEGAFSAPTSGERTTRIRAWLAQDPGVELLQEVFRELAARDKGAARPVRERLDEIRRAKGQEQAAAEWAAKAEALLALPKLNIADALAWQRDAAKAGAPLSKEPLLTLKAQLAERVRVIEDLQHTVQVQREAAVLLAQRIEVLSTKPWSAAQAVWDGLREDVSHWEQQAAALEQRLAPQCAVEKAACPQLAVARRERQRSGRRQLRLIAHRAPRRQFRGRAHNGSDW